MVALLHRLRLSGLFVGKSSGPAREGDLLSPENDFYLQINEVLLNFTPKRCIMRSPAVIACLANPA
jgi:hypothetical protein